MLDRFEDLADGLNHPEGVTWNPVDGLIYAGGEGGEFYSVTLDGELTLVGSSGGSMLGLAVDAGGRVYACDVGKGEIARLDPSTGAVETYARGVDGGDMDCPNVAAFGPDGMLYVTCSGEDDRPEIVRIAPGGGVADRWTTTVPAYPNGCLVTPDGSALVVVEAKAERVVRLAIRADGSAGVPETIAELPDTDADGIALDADGNYWVTLYRPDGLVRITPDGATELVVDDHLASTLDAPTNIAWVGANLDRAVVSNVGGTTLSIADLGVAGHPLHLPEVP
ncbi:MAG TPA: SMP-30/gluconolactonase/LRE family protein [Actinomycetota bacterium]